MLRQLIGQLNDVLNLIEKPWPSLSNRSRLPLSNRLTFPLKTEHMLLRNGSNATKNHHPRRFSQRGRMIPIAMANRIQILRTMCHIFAVSP